MYGGISRKRVSEMHPFVAAGTSILQGISQVSGAHRILSINIIFIRDIAKKICGEE